MKTDKADIKSKRFARFKFNVEKLVISIHNTPGVCWSQNVIQIRFENKELPTMLLQNDPNLICT